MLYARHFCYSKFLEYPFFRVKKNALILIFMILRAAPVFLLILRGLIRHACAILEEMHVNMPIRYGMYLIHCDARKLQWLSLTT